MVPPKRRGRPKKRPFSASYVNYLKSEKWAAKKRAYYARYGKNCKACGTIRGTIELHHAHGYDRMGRERLSELKSMCKPCHKEIHDRHRRAGRREDISIVTERYIAEKRKGR